MLTSQITLLHNDLLHLVLELSRHVLSFNLFDLGSRVLLDELVNVHVSASHSDLDRLALLDLEVDLSLTESVNAFGLSEEEDLHPILFRPVLDIVCQHLVHFVILLTDVTSRKITVLLLKVSDLVLVFLQIIGGLF